MINKAVNSAKWKGLRMGRSGPIISQFFLQMVVSYLCKLVQIM